MRRKQQEIQCTLIIGLPMLLLVLLAACRGTGNDAGDGLAIPAPDSQQVLRLPIGQTDFTTLDPALVQDGGDLAAIQAIFTGLVQFDDHGSIKDQLAASHSVSPDGLTYTFTLRPNTKFSDGTSMTAADVAYSINRTLLPTTQSPVTNYLSLLKDYTKITSGQVRTLIGDSLIVKDIHTLVIVLRQAQSYFLQTLAYPTSYVVERKLVDRYGKDWTDHLAEGGGAGPFKVANYSHTVGLDLIPNTHYYGRQPKLRELQLHISGDVNTTYKAYLSGQYDQTGIPISQLDSARQRRDYIHKPALTLTMIQLNYAMKPFDNLKIRQAFDVALNRDLIANDLLRGVVSPTHRYIPVGMYGASPNEVKGPDDTTSTHGNSATARALLQQGLREEGYVGINQLSPITLSTTNTFDSLKLINALADQWKTILGITVHINAIDPNQYSQEVGTGKLQAWAYTWQADYPDPHDWLVVFFGKGQDYNTMHYGQNDSPMAPSQQGLQDEMQQADTIRDATRRATMYNEIEQKLASTSAWIPLYQGSSSYLQNPHVHGMVDDPLGIIAPDDWQSIYMTI